MSDSAPAEFRERIEIHEREFQRYSVDNRIYCVPVDEEEEDRLYQQHRMLLELFESRLFLAPLSYPMRILDCGYGRGSWAIQMAQTYYHSEVTAIDVYPAELDDQPDNLECEVWDLNQPLTPTYKPNHYDFIHSRFVAPGIRRERWRTYVRDLRRLAKSGGWVQLAEFYYIIQSDSGRLTDDHALVQWGNGYRYCMERDRDPRVARQLGELLRGAGLVDVQEVTYRVPIGNWPTDARQRSIGVQNLENISVLLDSLAIWPFTARMRWTKAQVDALTERARQETRDTRLKLYIPLTVAWGRKR